MREIEFRSGYYEWNVIVDGNVIKSFDNLDENVVTTQEDLLELVDDLIYFWEQDLLEEENTFPLTLEEQRKLIEIMNITLAYYFDIKE